MIVRYHEKYPLMLLNYPPYTYRWTAFTSQCRGLILHQDTYEIIARPFKKFFNLHETPPPPHTDGLLYDKMDGSLIIATHHEEFGDIVATRGSFESEQAQMARKYIKTMEPNYTYLFELVGPDNKIVVNYTENELILLAMIHTQEDIEVPYNELDSNYKIVRARSCNSDELPSTFEANFEGYVWKCENFRVKVKSPAYLALHRIKFQLTPKFILESLADGTLDIDLIPEEAKPDVMPIIDNYLEQYNYYENEIQKVYSAIPRGLSRKEFAQQALQSVYATALFNKLDGKDPDIWKYVS